MRRVKLTRQEKAIEDALVNGEFVPLNKARYEEIANALHRRKKDTALSIRVNSEDLRLIKQKAKKLGVKYQTFLSEVIHHVAI